jgi:Fe-S-cluster containining protein
MDEDQLRAALQQLVKTSAESQQGIAELQQQFETLVEIMVHAGTLRPAHTELIARLRKRVEASRKSAVELSTDSDKYTVQGEPIDCESRLELCQARCCSFAVVLSRQDVEEGELTWEIDHPYRLPRSSDGYCVNLGGADAHCQRYEVRPATCRSYTCKNDSRVWIDFEARIAAPMPVTLIPLNRLTARRALPR